MLKVTQPNKQLFTFRKLSMLIIKVCHEIQMHKEIIIDSYILIQ